MSNQFFQYSFNPNNNQTLTHIATLDRAQKDGLIKSIQKIISLCKPTNILFTNSQAIHWLRDGAGLLCIDLKGLLETDVSIGLINQGGLSRSLSGLKNESDLTISSAHQGQVYRFVAGTSEINVPAALIDRTELLNIDFKDAVPVGSPITINDTTSLTGHGKKTPVKLHLHANQLSSVWFPDGVCVIILAGLSLCESPSQPDLFFRSYAFLRCVGKKADLKVLRDHDQYWLLTESSIGVGIQACLYEPLFSIF